MHVLPDVRAATIARSQAKLLRDLAAQLSVRDEAERMLAEARWLEAQALAAPSTLAGGLLPAEDKVAAVA